MKENFLDDLKDVDNYTFTENGAVALRSTGNKVLDAFGSLGAMKDCSAEDILNKFYNAFNEDKNLAMRLLFYIRDVRGGQGMRRVFRIIMRSLAKTEPTLVLNNLDNFLFFGRGDDVVCLLDTDIKMDVIEWIGTILEGDIIALEDHDAYPTMLAKWLPSENTSSKESRRYARLISQGLNWTPKHYRQILSKLRKKIGIVESLMSNNKWEEIKFDKLPSKASMIYSDAFIKHVKDNYVKYLEDLSEGKVKINASALFPVDIIHKILEKGSDYNIKDEYLFDAMWKALPNYFEGKDETGLCVVDTSWSMDGDPLEVALSLGLYCADKAKGPFKNHFITFSANPKLQEVKGNNIIEKVHNMETAQWMTNTDIEKVFSLILKTAVMNNTPQEDLPSKLYIISDMQWDESVKQNTNVTDDAWDWIKGDSVKPETFIETMGKIYAEKGYKLPAIVYWNVRESKCGMYQQTADSTNCCMVSGYSPSLFKSVIEGTEYEEVEAVDKETGKKIKVVTQKLDPLTIMLNTLTNERYDRVVVE